MRVAIVAYIDLDYGMGATRRVTMLANGLRSAGLEVILVGAVGVGSDFDSGDGGRIAEEHRGRAGGSVPRGALARRVAAYQELKALLRRGLDWVLFYNLGADVIPFVVAARLHGAFVITDTCDLRRGWSAAHPRQVAEAMSYWAADRTVKPHADLNIVVSRYLKTVVERHAPTVPIFRLPALVDLSVFARRNEAGRAFRQQWSLGEQPVIMYMGGTQRFEGLADLFAAASILRRQGRTFRLVVGGEVVRSPFHDNAEHLAETLELRAHVRCLGRLNLPGLVAALSAADVLVVPKRNEKANIAGFPQKLAEYLAVGRPVVATPVGDIPLYLRDRENALLCEANEPASLATTLDEVIRERERFEAIGIEGRKVAETVFDLRVQGRRLEETLVALRHGNREPRP